MKYPPIGKDLFIQNRKKFSERLKSNSVAIFNSNDIMPTSADGTMPFIQDANIFYLSGIDQEESILLLAPGFPDERFREILFLKDVLSNRSSMNTVASATRLMVRPAINWT